MQGQGEAIIEDHQTHKSINPACPSAPSDEGKRERRRVRQERKKQQRERGWASHDHITIKEDRTLHHLSHLHHPHSPVAGFDQGSGRPSGRRRRRRTTMKKKKMEKEKSTRKRKMVMGTARTMTRTMTMTMTTMGRGSNGFRLGEILSFDLNDDAEDMTNQRCKAMPQIHHLALQNKLTRPIARKNLEKKEKEKRRARSRDVRVFGSSIMIILWRNQTKVKASRYNVDC